MWPVGYTLSAVSCMALAVKPHRWFLHIWAALLISIQLIRAIMFFLDPALPELRWASLTINAFFAILVYFVWAGWKDRLPDGYPETEVITLPVKTVETIATHSPTSPTEVSKADELAELEAIAVEQQAARQQRTEQYRLPQVPGLG